MVNNGLETFKVFLGYGKHQTIEAMEVDQFILGSISSQVVFKDNADGIVAFYSSNPRIQWKGFFVLCKKDRGA